MDVALLNHLVGVGALGMQAFAVLLFAFWFVRADFPLAAAFVRKWSAWLALLLTLASVGMALFYSDYLGFVPCFLCWWQRVFLFPQAILFAVAVWKKESARIADYSITLSLFGGAVALYQHYIQMVGESPFPCPASGGDCVKRFLFEFGYVTFPLVAFSVFALLVVLMLFARASSRPSAGT